MHQDFSDNPKPTWITPFALSEFEFVLSELTQASSNSALVIIGLSSTFFFMLTFITKLHVSLDITWVAQ
jgi:hypothetical protein